METMSDWVALIIDNDRDASDGAKELARQCIAVAPLHESVQEGIWTIEEARKFLLADHLKDWIEDQIDDLPYETFREGIVTTFARRAFEQVDWHDLAAYYLDSLKED
jgi:hypothetical protein